MYLGGEFLGSPKIPQERAPFFEVESTIELFKWIIAPGKDRWRNATTISLGLSWLLTIRHQIWDWRCAIYFHHSVSLFVCTIYLPPISAKYNLGDHLQMNPEPLGNPRLVSIHMCITPLVYIYIYLQYRERAVVYYIYNMKIFILSYNSVMYCTRALYNIKNTVNSIIPIFCAVNDASMLGF